MIGQTIVNVEMGKGRSRVSTVAAGLVLLLLVTALSDVMAKIPMVVLAAVMVIVAAKPSAGTAFVRRKWRVIRGRKRW
jgi:SulP family sulfate permease